MAAPVALIVNPIAGGGRAIRILSLVQRALHDQDIPFTTHISDAPGNPRALAQEAIQRGVGIVAAVGGDGLVGELADALAHTSTALAVLPAGTGNDFARAMGIDLRHPVSAVDWIAAGSRRQIDLARIRTRDADRYFCNVAGTGFDARVNEVANSIRLGMGTVKYVLAVAKTLPRFAPIPFTITADGAPQDLNAMLVIVGNGRSYGGGMRVTPDARLDDGLLDICIVRSMRRGAFVRAFPRVFRGTHTTHPKVQMSRASSIKIEASGNTIYADGERVGELPATIDVAPGALWVIGLPS